MMLADHCQHRPWKFNAFEDFDAAFDMGLDQLELLEMEFAEFGQQL